MKMMFVLHSKHHYEPAWPVAGIVSFFYMWMMFYLTGNALFCLHNL
jgi:hypothetical protein